MKKLLFLVPVFILFSTQTEAQKRRPNLVGSRANQSQISRPAVFGKAIVIDERLAVMREQPSLYAAPLQRIRRGNEVWVTGLREADGVKFYRVSLSAKTSGWVQSDAFIGKGRSGDDEKLARLIQGSTDFDQIERAAIFLENFPDSALRPAILLLFGDLSEDVATTVSRDATRRLDKREMTASGAPIHSFYLNYTSLDRYRKLGINFLFNSATKTLHYDGAAWQEILKKFPKATEANEAKKRLETLKSKIEKQN